MSLKFKRSFEAQAQALGYKFIAGVDESGRGPLAGPVVACACVFTAPVRLRSLNDCKKLTEKEREDLFQKLTNHKSVRYGIGVVNHLVIDEKNIFQASLYAMSLAIEDLDPAPDFLLVDGTHLPPSSIPGLSIVKGDECSPVIAAASIIAKVTRDQIMLEYSKKWPQYGFDKHKGYGTKMHLLALLEHGVLEIHRKTFAPVRNLCLLKV